MVDYTGDKLHYPDKETGEYVACEVFVAILPYSQYTYCEAQRNQKQETFIESCENAFHFYQGVPLAVIPDNLKSAVVKTNRYEPKITRPIMLLLNTTVPLFFQRVWRSRETRLLLKVQLSCSIKAFTSM